MNDTDPTTQSSAFARVLDSLLRPLVRALIAQGVTAPALYVRLKRLYVEVAEESFQIGGERQTDSRISMLTGVHRRDVREFRGADMASRTEAREKVTSLASVIGRWLADPKTSDAAGNPKPLPRSGSDPFSFESLVRLVSTDIRPKTVLDELERQGMVEVADGAVHLKTDAFIGPNNLDQKTHFFAENVGDHISAAVENLLAEEDPPFLERAVFYNRLTPASVDDLQAQAERLGTDVLIELNKMAHDRQAQDVSAEDGIERFRFGVFFYKEAEPPIDGGGKKADDAED
ncbi:MAG: DUF6502 family protein [Pseudomonadota bacterium]